MRRNDMIRPAVLDVVASSETLRDLAPLRRGGLFLSALVAVVAGPMALAPLKGSAGNGPLQTIPFDLRLTDVAARDAKARIADVWADEAQARLARGGEGDARPGTDHRRIAALRAASIVR
jgi:hypothetical protein